MAQRPEKLPNRRGRGFERAAGLLAARIRKAGEGRGFAVTRLLTHWAEIVGADIARTAQPIKVSYGREGFGATLTLLTTGPQAPMLQMRLPEIREKVNACYGYAAISHVKITQTAPTGFAEAQAEFSHAPKEHQQRPEVESEAREAARDVSDPGLRAALELLGKNVLSKS